MKKRRRKSLKAKKGVKIIVGIVLLIAIGLGIYFVTNGKDNKKSSNNGLENVSNEKLEEKHEEQQPVKKLKIVNEDSTSRPYAVMVNNINVARPLQSGLQDAYIIYEIIVEGGITRYMALFMDQETERIGSIRSSRHYFLDYALENDAIYVHHGQSPQAQSDFSTLGIDRIAVDSTTTGWRDKSLNVATEHTLFTSIDKLNNGLGKKRQTRNKNLLLNYSIEEIDLSEIANAKEANSVTIAYSKNYVDSYEYDAGNGYYLRSVNGKAHTDYVTKEQYHFKNIITYKVKNYPLNDGSGKDRQDINNVGSGTGYYISNGYSIPIKWEKTSRSSQTKYTLEDGSELKVNDGNTFIQIQPVDQNLTIS